MVAPCGKIDRMTHEPRLTQALRTLITSVRVAALGTRNPDGTPFVSMVPFAVESQQGHVVIHVSGLAPHTGNLERAAEVSLLIMQPECEGEPVHALPRVSLVGTAAVVLPESEPWKLAHQAYLERFPEAEPMTQLGDFRFVQITVTGARQVAGFGAARALDAAQILEVLLPRNT